MIAGKKHDPTFYPVIYGADREDDWTDGNVWCKANPSLDVTVPIEKVRGRVTRRARIRLVKTPSASCV